VLRCARSTAPPPRTCGCPARSTQASRSGPKPGLPCAPVAGRSASGGPARTRLPPFQEKQPPTTAPPQAKPCVSVGPRIRSSRSTRTTPSWDRPPDILCAPPADEGGARPWPSCGRPWTGLHRHVLMTMTRSVSSSTCGFRSRQQADVRPEGCATAAGFAGRAAPSPIRRAAGRSGCRSFPGDVAGCPSLVRTLAAPGCRPCRHGRESHPAPVLQIVAAW
jgi:hypothetical protein